MPDPTSASAGDLPRCPDCDAAVPPARHCSQCGNALAIPSLKLREIVATTLHTWISLEGPTLRTLRDLLRGPGKVARAWIDGRRTSYVHPIKFLFVVSLIIGLSYEPLMHLRNQLHEPGTPLYTVGLEGHSAVFSLLGILLPIPFAVALRATSRLLGVDLSWLEWYVLGAYACALGALLQLTFKLACLSLPSHWNGWLSTAEFALPQILLAWGAFHLAPTAQRIRSVVAAITAPALLLGVVMAIRLTISLFVN